MDAPPVDLGTVVQAHYSSTSNPVIHGLARGLLVTSLVLLERAGAPIALKPARGSPHGGEDRLRAFHGIGHTARVTAYGAGAEGTALVKAACGG
ncbi:DUF6086 family protein [Streptomyces sp. BE133]|uniref:DUF6086 family protein n=1 Tax=Streptomyces sp. BE133 TaxID=3002523 RepID=UPI003FA6AD69